MRLSDWSSDVCSSDLIPEMGKVPFVAELEAHAGQIGAYATRREEVRHIERIFAGLADRPPAARLPRDRPHELGVAIPASLPDIDPPAKLLQVGVVGGEIGRASGGERGCQTG